MRDFVDAVRTLKRTDPMVEDTAQLYVAVASVPEDWVVETLSRSAT